jgi:20S proteasome subunit alpha 7
MASSGSGYDLSSSTFSPDGRIFQVEYAHKAVENAGTALGLRCSDGVVLAVEKPLITKMLVKETTGRRVHTIDEYAGVAITGFVSDGRQIVNRAREEASNYDETYGTKIPPRTLANRLSAYVHYFTLHGALRPFGCSTLIAAYDPATKHHSLHMVEPSGVTYEYYGAAAGRGRQPARTEMEKLSINPKQVAASGNGEGELITCAEAVKQLAKIIYALHDEAKDKPFELEMSWLCEGSGWKHVGVPKTVIAEAVEWAKKEIEEAEGEESEEEDDDEMEE